MPVEHEGGEVEELFLSVGTDDKETEVCRGERNNRRDKMGVPQPGYTSIHSTHKLKPSSPSPRYRSCRIQAQDEKEPPHLLSARLQDLSVIPLL